jgi:hypothetical protein
MDGATKKTNQYIGILESARGVSRDMNLALDAHIQAITRVRNANVSIWQSCTKALELIEAGEPQS